MLRFLLPIPKLKWIIYTMYLWFLCLRCIMTLYFPKVYTRRDQSDINPFTRSRYISVNLRVLKEYLCLLSFFKSLLTIFDTPLQKKTHVIQIQHCRWWKGIHATTNFQQFHWKNIQEKNKTIFCMFLFIFSTIQYDWNTHQQLK